MRIAGAALFMSAAASFILACTVPDDQGAAIMGVDTAAAHNADAEPIRIKPVAVKPDPIVTETA